MKSLIKISIVLPLLLISSSAIADNGNVGFAIRNGNSGVVTAVSTSLEHNFDKTWSLTFFSIIANNGFAKAYAGPSFYMKNFNIFFAAGAKQQDGNFAPQFNLGFKLGDKNFFYAESEFDYTILKNTNNFWYDIYYQQSLEKQFSAGVRIRQGIGMGIFVDLKINPHIIVCWLPVNQEYNYIFDPLKFFVNTKIAF